MTEEQLKKCLNGILDAGVQIKKVCGGADVPLTFAAGLWKPERGGVLMSSPVICPREWSKERFARFIEEGTGQHPCDFAVIVAEAWMAKVTDEELKRFHGEDAAEVKDVAGAEEVLVINYRDRLGKRVMAHRRVVDGEVVGETTWSGLGERDRSEDVAGGGHDRFLDRVVFRREG